MPEWIPGGGFWLVQATREYSKAELKAEMDALEQRIETAKRNIALRKERSA